MTKIAECGRTIAGEVVAFDIQWEGDLSGDEVAWSARVRSPEGEEVRLVLERSGGANRQYVEAAGGREDVKADADVRDDDVIARFPASVVGVAAEWPVWTAVISVDGHEVAEQQIPLKS